jgi:flagellar basal-body rod protein FlgB
MVDSILFDRAVDVMHQALNVSSDRNQLITGNIANVDTVGYAPSDLDFKQSLVNAMADADTSSLVRTDAQHFSTGVQGGSGNAVTQSSIEAVDIDQEMTNLAENNVQYRTSSEMLIRKLAIIKYGLTEGGK